MTYVVLIARVDEDVLTKSALALTVLLREDVTPVGFLALDPA